MCGPNYRLITKINLTKISASTQVLGWHSLLSLYPMLHPKISLKNPHSSSRESPSPACFLPSSRNPPEKHPQNLVSPQAKQSSQKYLSPSEKAPPLPPCRYAPSPTEKGPHIWIFSHRCLHSNGSSKSNIWFHSNQLKDAMWSPGVAATQAASKCMKPSPKMGVYTLFFLNGINPIQTLYLFTHNLFNMIFMLFLNYFIFRVNHEQWSFLDVSMNL